MLNKYSIVPAKLRHVFELAPKMSEADRDEIWAAGHLSPKQALLESIRSSNNAQAGLINGRVVCMFGVGEVSLLSTVGVPWLLTSDELPKHSRVFCVVVGNI